MSDTELVELLRRSQTFSPAPTKGGKPSISQESMAVPPSGS
jgi:hypothetical protein